MKHEGGCVHHTEGKLTKKSGSLNTGGRQGEKRTEKHTSGTLDERGAGSREEGEGQREGETESLRARAAKKDPDPDRRGAEP